MWRGRGEVVVAGREVDVIPTGPRAARNYMRAYSEGPSLGVRGREPIECPLPRVRRDFGDIAPWRDRLR